MAALKSKIGRLNTAFTDGTMNIDEFRESKNPLVPKRVEIERRIIALQSSKADRVEPLRNSILEANQALTTLAEDSVKNEVIFTTGRLEPPFARKAFS
jgi:hypothetical protein